MADMINVKINGIAVSVPKGTTVLEAAHQAGVEIPKYKAYIEDAGSAAEGFLFEETTGISTIDAQEADAESYTLSGVRVNQPTQKGIYIVNGKKVVVK